MGGARKKGGAAKKHFSLGLAQNNIHLFKQVQIFYTTIGNKIKISLQFH